MNPDIQGYYDVLNFVWFEGAQYLFQGPPSNNQMIIEGCLNSFSIS